MKTILFAITLALASISATIMTGCGSMVASVGAPAPKSLSDQWAYAYGLVASIRTTAAQAHASGVLSDAGGQKVLIDTDFASSALDAAEVAIKSGDTSTAVAKLALATSLLTQLQTYLTNQGVK